MEYGMADFRLIDRKVLQEVLKFGEDGIFLRGLFQWVGYKSCRIRYKGGKRLLGKPQFTFMKLCKLSYAGITAFSIAPLRAAFLLGGLTVLFVTRFAIFRGHLGQLR
jgi:dolichol-phosphate mannosyltransferase